ncbi:MAG: aromatic ring-hydroxylating oxygenase subunit alpha [Flavobacteriales bacterium]
MFKVSKDIREAFTLPGAFYNSEEGLELCRKRLFHRSWQYIADSEVIRLPDSAYPFDFMEGFIEEPLLFTRDKQDNLHCFSNVCTHRGNILIDHPCTLNSGITCSYHGRRFNIDGTFRSMPECEGMKDFPSPEDDLSKLELKQWKQFMFTSIDPAFPFEAVFAEMEARVGWMPVDKFVFDPTRSQEYLVRANWALYCDNYLEGFHIPYIHKDLARSLDYQGYASEIYPWSNLQLGIAKGGEMAFDLPKDSPDYGKRVAAYYYWLFPNIMFNFYPWGLSLNIIRPLKHNLTRVIFRSYVWDPSKLDQGAGALLDRVEREDEAIVEKVQKGTNSLLYNKGRYSPKMEQGVHHFHRLITEMLSEK